MRVRTETVHGGIRVCLDVRKKKREIERMLNKTIQTSKNEMGDVNCCKYF